MAEACAKCGSIPTGSLVPLRGQDVCIPCCNEDVGYWRERALRAEERLWALGAGGIVLTEDGEADEEVSQWIRERKGRR